MKIKSWSWAVLVAALMGLSSCSTSEKAIGYKEALRYFVRNDVKDFSPRIITSEEELNLYFGMGAVMGTQGMPTLIDFDKENAIAILEPTTNRDTEIKIENIKKQGGKVVVRYKSLVSSEPRSYSITPFQLVKISKKYGDNVEFVKE